MLLATTSANAVKMKPGPTTITQSDGSTLTVYAYGDEDFNYFTTTDGVLLCQEDFDFFIATTEKDGTLSPTKVLAHEQGARTDEEKEAIALQDKQLMYDNMNRISATNKIKRVSYAFSSTLFPHVDSPRIPVLLVEFSDSTFKIDNTKVAFDKYMNAEELFVDTIDTDMDNNHGSVKKYFTDMSFGAFKPQFDVYGPYTLSKPLKSYGAGSSSNEDMKGLFTDACTLADADVDFSQYDSNGDGNVDLVYIVYAGYSAAWAGNSTDCIHPKSGTLSSMPEFDGKTIVRYGVNNELNGNPTSNGEKRRINGIGVFCHELSHCMGLPDIYPSSGSVAERCINQNMEYWDIMDGGEYSRNGYRPTEYTAWEREFFGWMKVDTLSSPADITLLPLSEGGKAYRILNDNDSTGNEYYMIENVQKINWNKSAYGHGMLITHVDYDNYYFSLGGCKVNSTAGHPRMHVMAADGMLVPVCHYNTTITEGSTDTEKEINATFYDKYGGQVFTENMYKAELAGDPFPGTSGVTEFTDTTTPASAWVYTGGYIGKPITDITENTETGEVSFKFMGGTETAIESVIKREEDSKAIYSLDGRYLGTDKSKLGKGIYIIGKKKVVL